jgi:hypothetical protein
MIEQNFPFATFFVLLRKFSNQFVSTIAPLLVYIFELSQLLQQQQKNVRMYVEKKANFLLTIIQTIRGCS